MESRFQRQAYKKRMDMSWLLHVGTMWFNTCWNQGWAIVNQHSQTPKHGFSNLGSWDLDPLLSCASYFPTLFILDFNPLHYIILPAYSLLTLLVPFFIFFQVYSYMWWLFLTKSWVYPQLGWNTSCPDVFAHNYMSWSPPFRQISPGWMSV